LGAAKTVGTILLALILVPLLLEAGLLLYSLQQMQVGSMQLEGDRVAIPLTIPNQGFIDLEGDIKVSILDRAGAVLEETTNRFTIPAGETRTITITARLPREGDPTRVRMAMVLRLLNIPIPLPAVETAIPTMP
jgi:hypothetical protein